MTTEGCFLPSTNLVAFMYTASRAFACARGARGGVVSVGGVGSGRGGRENRRRGSRGGWNCGRGEGLRPHLGEEGLLEGRADDLGAHVGVLEVRHTGDAPVRLRGGDRGERIFFQPPDGRGGNGRARAGAERGEREARDATFEEAARARRVARAASASTASSPGVRSRRTPRRGDDPFPVRAAGAGCQPGCDFRRAARRARRVRDGGGGARTAELAAADISLANGRS